MNLSKQDFGPVERGLSRKEHWLTHCAEQRSHKGNGIASADGRTTLEKAKISSGSSHESRTLIRAHEDMASWHLR
jgi:hypothetical protein